MSGRRPDPVKIPLMRLHLGCAHCPVGPDSVDGSAAAEVSVRGKTALLAALCGSSVRSVRTFPAVFIRTTVRFVEWLWAVGRGQFGVRCSERKAFLGSSERSNRKHDATLIRAGVPLRPNSRRRCLLIHRNYDGPPRSTLRATSRNLLVSRFC